MPKVSTKKTKSEPRILLWKQLLLGTLVLLGLVLFFGSWQNTSEDELRFGTQELVIEKASSDEDQLRGLSGRDFISDKAGMLFVFDSVAEHCFWMKDMNFPIDILWLNESKKVVHIVAHVPPQSYPESFCPPTGALYVLEVQAGLSEKAGVDVGSQL